MFIDKYCIRPGCPRGLEKEIRKIHESEKIHEIYESQKRSMKSMNIFVLPQLGSTFCSRRAEPRVRPEGPQPDTTITGGQRFRRRDCPVT